MTREQVGHGWPPGDRNICGMLLDAAIWCKDVLETSLHFKTFQCMSLNHFCDNPSSYKIYQPCCTMLHIVRCNKALQKSVQGKPSVGAYGWTGPAAHGCPWMPMDAHSPWPRGPRRMPCRWWWIGQMCRTTRRGHGWLFWGFRNHRNLMKYDEPELITMYPIGQYPNVSNSSA